MQELVIKGLVVTVVIGGGTAYVRGWYHLRAAGYDSPAWRCVLYVAGLASIAIALLSPIDERASEQFSVHMIQHLLLTMLAAPLLLLGNPFPFVLWGLPRRPRHAVAAAFRPRARVRRVLAVITRLAVAGPIYVVTLWVWHLPRFYEAALNHEILHALEHLGFFGTAILFWWPIIRPAPCIGPRPHAGFQILYLMAATGQNIALGGLLSVPERLFYPHYAQIATGLGAGALDDQMLGGGIMWESGHMYLLPILVILYRLSQDDSREQSAASIQ
jgi:putative membrane protein